jgi:multiphosphoryl transfer protein
MCGLLGEASQYQASIEITNLSRQMPSVNSISIYRALGIGVLQGQQILLKAFGIDAEAALTAIGNLIKPGFGELE